MKTKQILLTLLMAFWVPLAMNAQIVYSENFDSYTVGSSMVTPTGWTVTTTGTGVSATVINANAYSNPNSFLMGNPQALTTNRSLVAVLPTLDLNLNCTKLTFRVKSSSASMGSNTLSVGYTYSDLSGDHTQVLHTCDASTSYTEVTLSFNLSVVPNNARIFFRYNGKKNAPAQTYWYIDNVVVSNDLQAPTDLMVSDITASTATMTWSMNGHYGSAEVMYSTQSDFSNPQYVTSGSLTDLEGYTTYYAKVRARSRKNASSMWYYSSWSDPVEFTTLCAPPANFNIYSEPALGVVASWDGNASSYNLRYESMESVYNYYNGMVSTSGNSYTFTGQEAVPLVQGMKYRFSVQAQCDPEMVGEWSDWITYADCPNYLSLPLHQNFDHIPVLNTNTENNLPGCWMILNNATDPAYKYYPLIENADSLCYSSNASEGQYNYIRFNTPINTANQCLVLPAIDPVSSNGVTVSFWIRNVSSETLCNCVVGLMDQTLNMNNIYIKDGSNIVTHSTTYQHKTITFTYDELMQYGNYIAIKAPSASQYYVSFCIDDIDIYPADYQCNAPINIKTTTLGMVLADISWESEPGTASNTWCARMKKASDTEWGEEQTGIATPHWFIYNLEENTTYDVQIRHQCNSVDYSDWVDFSFTTLDHTPIPTDLVIDTVNSGSSWVEIVWECLLATGQNEIDHYEIQLDSNDVQSWDLPFYSLSVIEKGQHTFHIRVVDDQGITGEWSEMLSFVIEGCDNSVDIDSEHSASYDFQGTHLPDCWTVSGNTDHFSLGSALAFMVDDNYETYVELPQYNIADDFDCVNLVFDWQQLPSIWGNGTRAGVQVQYSTNGTNWLDTGDFISLYGDMEDSQMVNYNIKVPAPVSTLNIRLKLIVEDYQDYGDYPPMCRLDNLYVIGHAVCADVPAALQIMEGYPANGLVFVSWTAGNDEQTEWQLAISKNSNSNWQITSPFMSTDCVMGFYVDHNSTYYVKVRAYCDNDHYSVWSNEIIFTTPYFGKIFTGAEDNLWSNANNWTGGIPSEDDDVLLQADVTVTGEAEAYNIDMGTYTITVENGGLLNANAFIGENASNPLKTVIKDGGQMKSNTSFLARIEKNILGYGAANGEGSSGYYLISTPFTHFVNSGNVTPEEDGNLLYDQMDLYWFTGHNEGEEWYNPKYSDGTIDGRTVLIPHKGYLYARQNDGTIRFGNNLDPFPATNENIVVNLSSYTGSTAPLNGWNLIGNPFSCNAYMLGDDNQPLPYYRMNETGDALVKAVAGTPIKPCEGVLVFCPNDGLGHSAIFTTTAPEQLGGEPSHVNFALPVHSLIGNQPAFLGTTTQTIVLSAGINWVSFNVETTLDDLKAALVEALPGTTSITIRSQNSGYTTYNGTRWRGSLGAIELTQMCMITVDAACEISLEGTAVDPAEHPIVIPKGVKWFAFPLSESMSINDAFAGFNPVNGDMIKSAGNGTATYNGSRWRGALSTLMPGQGYIFSSSNSVTESRPLVFPAP